jgi:hypothetical protein
MLGQWRQLVAVGFAMAVIAVGIVGPTVGQGLLIGSLIHLLGIGGRRSSPRWFHIPIYWEKGGS